MASMVQGRPAALPRRTSLSGAGTPESYVDGMNGTWTSGGGIGTVTTGSGGDPRLYATQIQQQKSDLDNANALDQIEAQGQNQMDQIGAQGQNSAHVALIGGGFQSPTTIDAAKGEYDRASDGMAGTRTRLAGAADTGLFNDGERDGWKGEYSGVAAGADGLAKTGGVSDRNSNALIGGWDRTARMADRIASDGVYTPDRLRTRQRARGRT